MRLGFIQRLLRLNYPYNDVFTQERAQLLLYIINFIIAISVVWTLFISLPDIITGQLGIAQIASPLILLVSIGLYILIERGEAKLASYIFISLIIATNVLPQINNLNSAQALSMILPLVLTSVLLTRREIIVVTLILVLIILRGGVLASSGSNFNLITALGISLNVLLSGVFLSLYNNSLEKITSSATKLISRTRLLNQVTRHENTDSDDEIRSLIVRSISELRSQMGFSYIRVVLLNEQHNPTQTYYSSIGVEQIGQTTNFSFTRNSGFQQALDTLKPQLISQQDLANLSSHLLPASTYSLIVPAHSLNQTIALFDIQTEDQDGISSEMIAVLNLFVSQVAAQLIYHQTVRDLLEDLQSQQVLIDQQREQILRIQNLQTEGIVTDWENYLRLRGLPTIGYDIDNKRQISQLTMGQAPEEITPTLENGEITIETKDDDQIVTIPIRLRDTTLGAMSFTIPASIPISDRKIEFIRSVTERLALALDNKRLLEQTQTQAQRVSIANEIGNVLLSSTDVETVLNSAAERFNEALGAITTQIYLQPSAVQSIDPQQGDTV